MYTVDLNCDLGESFGNYVCGMDDQILPLITSANVACGFHASDPLTMEKTVESARNSHVSVGAHPGFPDLVGFGRRNMSIPAPEITALVEYQIGALLAFCRAKDVPLRHVKPHGALYNMAAKDALIADAICQGIAAVDDRLILLAPAHSELIRSARKCGLRAAREVFADRAYEEDGSLVPRSKPGSMITDEKEAIRRVIQMVEKGTVEAITGKEIEVEADSICVHGDSPSALSFVRQIRRALKENGIQIVPLYELAKGGKDHE